MFVSILVQYTSILQQKQDILIKVRDVQYDMKL